MADPITELVDDSQMARLLRVNVGWLREEAEARRIPSLKAGRRFLFNRNAVVNVLAKRAAEIRSEDTEGG